MSCHDMEGRVVSEEEAATGLGFKDVIEMRRWQTEMGHKVWELQNSLRAAKNDSNYFQWHGRRQLIVLEKLGEFLKKLQEGAEDGVSLNDEEMDELRLAVGVMTGNAIDWHNVLKDWFPKEKDLPPEDYVI